MARVTWTAKLRRDKVDVYLEAHAAVWPEMLAALKQSGVRNYSIHHLDDRVFGYYECDDPGATDAVLMESEAARRWKAAMEPYFSNDPKFDGITRLREVFRLD